MRFVPVLTRSIEGGELRSIAVGHPLLDDYLEFVAARGAVNTWLATAYDLKVFFTAPDCRRERSPGACRVSAPLGRRSGGCG